MPTQTKKTSSRVVAGSTKKSKSSESLTKRTALFGLVGITAFSVVAGLGWQKWQDRQLKAKAAGWTTIFSGSNTRISACRVYPTLVQYYITNNNTATANVIFNYGPYPNVGPYRSASGYATAGYGRINGSVRWGNSYGQSQFDYPTQYLAGC